VKVNELVIDCSVSATWVLPGELSARSERLLTQALDGEVRLLVPTLWHYESLNLLRSAVLRKRLTEPEAKKALHLLSEIPMEVVDPDLQGRPVILEAALRHRLSAYDASYLALADSRGVGLLTADSDLITLRRLFKWIVPLDNY
jgi:predicted nucleic acid-binding protein